MDVYTDFSHFYDIYVGDWLDDLPFYLEYAKRATGPILEVGTGSGRLTIPLARAGVEVTALDSSSSMLAKLEARLKSESKHVQDRISIVCTNAQMMELPKQYELIIVPFYTFNYFLTAEEQTAVLRRLLSHLSQTGQVLLDVFVPHKRIKDCPTEPVLRVDTLDPQSGCKIRGWNAYRMDTQDQLEIRRHIFEVTSPDGTVSKREFTSQRRYFFKSELERLFSKHGFRIEAVFEGYEKCPATDGSEQLMFVLAHS